MHGHDERKASLAKIVGRRQRALEDLELTMKVLLTGNRGYIGSVLTPMLLERNHQVTGLDSDLFQDCTYAGQMSDTPQIRKDIRDVTIDDVAGFDAIIHLAGLSNDP